MAVFARISAVVLLSSVVAAPALAVRPTIEVLEVPEGPFPVSGVCEFDVLAEQARVGNKEKVATLYDQDGEVRFQILTGVNQWRFTNAATGRSLVINASGPGRFFVQPGTDTVRLESGGVSFFFFASGAQPAGWPAFPLTRGRMVAELDPATFTLLSVTVHQGTMQDICELLE